MPSGVLHLKESRAVLDLNKGEDRKDRLHRDFSSVESSGPQGHSISNSRGPIRLRVLVIADLKWDSIASAASKAWAAAIRAALAVDTEAAYPMEAVGAAVAADNRIEPNNMDFD